MKYILVFLTTVLIIGAGLFLVFYQVSDNLGDSTFRKITLTSKDNSTKLFIKSENWGLTADEQITVISLDSEKEFKADSTREFIFYGLEPFLYKVENDTLFLLVRQKAKVPRNFSSTWTIIQKEIENPEFMTNRANVDFETI